SPQQESDSRSLAETSPSQPAGGSLDPGEHVPAGLFPVAEKRLGRQIALRDEFTIDIEDPARMDVVQHEMSAVLASGDANAVGHIGLADLAGMAAVDMKDVERKFRPPVDEPREDLTRIAGEQVDPARELPFQEIHALRRVGVRHDIDAVIFEPRTRRERQERAVARVDADFQQALLESHRPPNIAASGDEFVGRRQFGVALVAVGVEYVSLERFAGMLDDFGDASQALAESVSEDLVQGVAAYRIVGNFR